MGRRWTIRGRSYVNDHGTHLHIKTSCCNYRYQIKVNGDGSSNRTSVSFASTAAGCVVSCHFTFCCAFFATATTTGTHNSARSRKHVQSVAGRERSDETHHGKVHRLVLRFGAARHYWTGGTHLAFIFALISAVRRHLSQVSNLSLSHQSFNQLGTLCLTNYRYTHDVLKQNVYATSFPRRKPSISRNMIFCSVVIRLQARVRRDARFRLSVRDSGALRIAL